MKNILIAVDFHEKTQLFVDKAQELAKSFDSKVWLLHVSGVKPDNEEDAQELRDEQAELQVITDHLIKQGIATEAIFAHGPTIDSILEKAKEFKIDLIISGHHKHGFLYRALYGDTTKNLIKKSKIPVLVVPLDD